MPSQSPQQHYGNHTRIDPLYHPVLALMTLIVLVGSAVHVFRTLGAGENALSALLLLGIAVLLAFFYIFIRRYPLVVQDRAIRAEENLRHYVLTGRLLDPRLTPRQIVALRFAGDEEFPALASRAAQEGLKPKEIKQAVQKWRPDTYRV